MGELIHGMIPQDCIHMEWIPIKSLCDYARVDFVENHWASK